MAPGTWILSTYADLYQIGYDPAVNPQNSLFQDDGFGYPFDQYYKYFGGTSMATPIVSGAAALVREYYMDAESHTPSAALLKATLINSAVDLLDENNDGANDNDFPIPNSHEGWGRIDVDEATDGDHEFFDGTSVAAGATISYEVVAAGGSPLKITVVWTDSPSTPAAGVNLVNNLDVTVTAPNGTTKYLGNDFAGGWSTTGGAADNRNNVENVYIQSATAGTWTIEVTGLSVPQGPQPFAIVVEGGTLTDVTPPTWPDGAILSQTGATGSTVTVDWSANPATAEGGVAGYDIYVGGVFDQAVLGTSTDATVTGLDDSTMYAIKVEARDSDANATTDGPSVSATTLDTTAPSWPDTTISSREVFETSFELNWVAATDINGIAIYRVFDGVDELTSTTGTSVTFTTATAETTYNLTVSAEDPSGNSTVGPAIVVTTAPDFADTNGSIFEDDIAWLAARGITLGCGENIFLSRKPADPRPDGHPADSRS